MSYREIRNFTEIMRALAYPRLISMENFRKPNFELVADILYWMVKLYDPETTISDRVEFENERVEFLTGIANLMATKARLKLNTKKLYASDGRAVQELLKLATLLYSSKKSTLTQSLLVTDDPPPQIKIPDIKAARLLATQITLSGAKVYDLLANEAAERVERSHAIRFLDKAASSADGAREQAFIESSIRELIDHSKQSADDMRKECDELEADSVNIESKIHRKQEELDRTEKRLKSLENVRPQFMDEVEKLEKELQRHYDIYMEKYRNLDYLEHESEKYRKHEEERMEEQDRRLKKTRERLLKEEVELLRGGRGDGDDELGGVPIVRMGQTQSQVPSRVPGRGANAKGLHGSQRKRSDATEDSSEGVDNLTDSIGNDSSDDDPSDGSGKGKAPPMRARGKPSGGERRGSRGSAGRGPGPKKAGSDSDDFQDDDDDDDDDGGDGDDSEGSDDNF